MMLQDSNKNTLSSAAEWLKKSDRLTLFTQRQQQDKELKTFLVRNIEELYHFKDDFHIAAMEENKLCLHTSSAVVASQLRLHQNLILETLHDEPSWKGTFTKLKVQVRPNFRKELVTHPKLQPMSAATASMLEQSAENINHPKLEKALRRLARHGRQPR